MPHHFMLAKINALKVDDVIILPKHKYENLNYRKCENQKTKYLNPSITNPQEIREISVSSPFL